jgi:SAM-dependent methyltransferase
LGRWARACGFAPVDLGLTVVGGGYDLLDVDMASIDVVARVHPGGCDATDIDEALSQAAWALRPGGLFVVTLPLGRPGEEDALGPADVRAIVARAHEQGYVLVGDLDGDVGWRMRAAGVAADVTPGRIPGAAYGLVRLTLRRR